MSHLICNFFFFLITIGTTAAEWVFIPFFFSYFSVILFLGEVTLFFDNLAYFPQPGARPLGDEPMVNPSALQGCLMTCVTILPFSLTVQVCAVKIELDAE